MASPACYTRYKTAERGVAVRVLRVIPDLQVGGVQRQLFRSVSGLAAKEIASEICCLRERGAMAEDFERDGFPVHLAGFRSRLDPRGLARLRRLVRRGRFDVVHGHMYAANLASNLATLGLSQVTRINGYHSTQPAFDRGQAAKIRLTKWIPDGFVAVSQAVADALAEIGIPRQRIHIVHNGIELPTEPQPLRQAEPGSPLILIWAGRFVRQKRTDFLLEVVDRCRSRGVNVLFRLIGEGPTRSGIQEQILKRGLQDCVQVPGISNDMCGELASADLYVSASEREGFSNVLLEAGAMARGSVLSDIDPHREFIGSTEAGVICGRDPDAWAELLERLGRDREQVARMGNAAFQRATNYSVSAACNELATVYTSLAEARRRRRLRDPRSSPRNE